MKRRESNNPTMGESERKKKKKTLRGTEPKDDGTQSISRSSTSTSTNSSMPSSSAPPPEAGGGGPTAEDYVNRGNQYYSEGDSRKALHYFEKACLSCPCNAPARASRRAHMLDRKARGLDAEPLGISADRVLCECRREAFDAAVVSSAAAAAGGMPPSGFLRRFAREAVAASCTTCGSGSGSGSGSGGPIVACTRDLHVAAADGSAACLEAQRDFEAAYRTGVLVVLMAPGRAEGYLRAAKACSKRNALSQPTSSQSSPADGQSQAAAAASVTPAMLYRHARANIDTSNPDDSKVKFIRRVLACIIKVDPITRLPREIALMIFQELITHDKVKCLRVSRSWREFLSSPVATGLWADLDLSSFPRVDIPLNGKRLPTKTIAALIQRSKREVNGRIQPTTRRFALRADHCYPSAERKVVQMLARLDMLEHLELIFSGSRAVCDYLPVTEDDPDYLRDRPTVRSVVLHRIDRMPWYPAAMLMLQSFSRLEFLEMFGSHAIWEGRLDSLRYLHLRQTPSLNLRDLNLKAPNLEQLYLNDCWLRSSTEDLGAFANLQCLFIGEGVQGLYTPTSFLHWFPALPPSLRVLDLNCTDPTIFNDIVHGHNPGGVPFGFWSKPELVLTKLEFFRVADSGYTPEALYDFLRPSLEARTLHTLVVAMPLGKGPHNESRDYRLFIRTGLPLDSLTAVGLTDFFFSSESYRSTFTAQPFVDWLAYFPNVHTVHFFPERFPERADAIVPLIQKKGIKRIYENCLSGVFRDEILTYARKHGVEIIKTYGRGPADYPYGVDQKKEFSWLAKRRILRL